MKKSNAKEIENDDVDVCDSAFFPFTIAFELWIRESSADLLWYKLEKNPQQYHHLWLKKKTNNIWSVIDENMEFDRAPHKAIANNLENISSTDEA